MPGRRDSDDILEEVRKLSSAILVLQEQYKELSSDVRRHDDLNEGTVQRKGMKERITMAEHEIQTNREAWTKTEQNIREMNVKINQTIQEAFTEVKAEFGRSVDSLRTEIAGHRTFIQKAQPYISVIGWLVLTIGGLIIAQILTGRWRIVIP